MDMKGPHMVEDANSYPQQETLQGDNSSNPSSGAVVAAENNTMAYPGVLALEER